MQTPFREMVGKYSVKKNMKKTRVYLVNENRKDDIDDEALN